MGSDRERSLDARSTAGRVTVIGSIMVDRVVAVPKIVPSGATVTARGIEVHPGGKGANQAAAAAMAGAEVTFAGRTGHDGAFVLEALRERGVDTSACRIDDGPSGTAFVQVAPNGENAIAIVPEANARFDRDDLAKAIAAVGADSLVLLQHETALLAETIDAAADRGARVWLNAAPADRGVLSLPLHRLDALIVNEHEAATLTHPELAPDRALEALASSLPTALVIITLGRDGAIAARGDRRWKQPSFPVHAIDTVGCGDAFVGAFAAAIAAGRAIERALQEGCAAGALAATRRGAIPSLPVRAAIDQLCGSVGLPARG
jgi:ribokinase